MKILDDTKVVATPEAIKLIEKLKEKYGPDLLFHQSGGCCDGSAPMCYLQSEYIVGDNDVKLGEIGGIPFYISEIPSGRQIRYLYFAPDFFKKHNFLMGKY